MIAPFMVLLMVDVENVRCVDKEGLIPCKEMS
jgi:hypothetical protein